MRNPKEPLVLWGFFRQDLQDLQDYGGAGESSTYVSGEMLSPPSAYFCTVYTPRLLNNLLVRKAVSSWYNVSMELRLDENGCPLDRTLLIGRAFVHFKGKRYQLLVPGDEEGEVRRHGKRLG